MIDPISAGNISSQATQQANQTQATKHTITNEDFETVRTKSAELDHHVEQLKESGLVSHDHVQMANHEAQAMYERIVQPGNEISGLNSLFYDNRSKLESLKADLDKISSKQDPSVSGKVGNYLDGLSKEF